MNSSGSSAPVAFQDVLAAMAEVDRLKSREELLAAEADLPARVADVTARLKDVYARQGVPVADDVIARGVEQFFSQRLTFQAPRPNLATQLAVLWIHRVRVMMISAALGLVAVAGASGIYFGIVVPAREARAREIAKARQLVASARDALQATTRTGTAVFAHAQQEFSRIRQIARDDETPKAVVIAEAKLSQEHAAFDDEVKRAEEALAPFAAPANITDATAPAATLKARRANELEAAARHECDQATALPHQLADLQAERTSLEAAWKRLDHPGIPAAMRSAGEQAYGHGLALVVAFAAASEVHAETARIQKLADAETALRALPDRIKSAASEARIASRDPKANELIAASEQGGLAAVSAGDAAAAERYLTTLHDLTARLGETFVLRIVNRPGEYTRLWRYPRGNTSVKNFYVVVEAVTIDGRPVPVKIRSEEDNSAAVVSKWAERVDEATYESVGRDKKDDGIIQNNAFGQKEKGRLAPTYLMGTKTQGGDVEAGRIHRWEYRG